MKLWMKKEDDGGQRSKVPDYIQPTLTQFIRDGFKWRTDNAEASDDAFYVKLEEIVEQHHQL